jgi:transketolase
LIKPNFDKLRQKGKFIRKETIRLIEIAGSGHYSSVFSAADILATLYYHSMRLDKNPNWPERDRLILSKGHVATGIYPILADKGYFPKEWLENYAHLGSPLGDHPDMRKIPGIDFSSGSLGHGLSIGVGMALGLRKKFPYARVFVLLGDGELNEGQVWEAAQSAAHFKLSNLVGIIDRNQMQLDGASEKIMSVEPLAAKWEAFGWKVQNCDGHDYDQLVSAFDSVRPQGNAPHMIIADTVKGKGIKYMETARVWHLGYLHGQDAADAIEEIG